MITWDQAIEIIHVGSLTQRDTLLLLLATDPEVAHKPAAVKARGKQAGVKGVSGWNISVILGKSKGQALPSREGWLLTKRGRDRVTELAQVASIDIATHSTPLVVGAKSRSGAVVVPQEGFVCIGHGHSPVWKDLREFLERKLLLQHDEFNRVSSAGMTNVERIEHMLRESMFAFIVLTAEDEQKDGKVRARQNVVHEVGLFQGRLGFRRAIILLEEGCDEFSNIHGLTQIRFPHSNLMAVAEQVRDVLQREGIFRSVSRVLSTRAPTFTRFE